MPIILLVGGGSLAYAGFNFLQVKRLDEGSPLMQKIAGSIRIGAKAFLYQEYIRLGLVTMATAIIIGIFIAVEAAIALIIGALMSTLAGFCGMKAATYAGVRTANQAKMEDNLGKTLQVSYKGSTVMALCVGGFALLGLAMVFWIFGFGCKQFASENLLNARTNWLGISFVPFLMTLSGYGLGCSLVAMFNRIGGGIYTKAADMGADLVGKVESHIPEDDYRNPAVIADAVGDNVNDIAGMGSDLLESYIGALVAAMILAIYQFRAATAIGGTITESTLQMMVYFPLIVAAIGMIGSVMGILWLLKRNTSQAADPHLLLNSSTWIAGGFTIAGSLLVSGFCFRAEAINVGDFVVGWLSPWLAVCIGVLVGIGIGMFAEYYTNDKYKPTKQLAEASKEGPAIVVDFGLALGMSSCLFPCLLLALGIIVAAKLAGVYGVALTAVGMLSFVTATVAVDSYGPIADNAGGIAEMAGLDASVRRQTDKLDSVGNTTAAIGKGFAIGAGALTALSLMISYLYSYHAPAEALELNIINSTVLAGSIVGAALPFMFSGILIYAVVRAAQKMVDEVRQQFTNNPGILAGTAESDHESCIRIVSQHSLRQMKRPALLALIIPPVAGLILGAEFVGGLLIGSILSAIMIAIFAGNSGGAWDNAKKHVEANLIEKFGVSAHEAAVIGDTIGDALKDVVGVCMDIFIKLESTAALMTVAVFNQYNLVNWLGSIF